MLPCLGTAAQNLAVEGRVSFAIFMANQQTTTRALQSCSIPVGVQCMLPANFPKDSTSLRLRAISATAGVSGCGLSSDQACGLKADVYFLVISATFGGGGCPVGVQRAKAELTLEKQMLTFSHFAEIEIGSGRSGDWGQLGKDVSTSSCE